MQTPAAQAEGGLDADGRRLLIAVCVVSGAVAVVPATYNFLLNPMLSGLNASQSDSSLLRQLPSISALLVIFIAGALGARLGERRLITGAALLFTAGSAVVAAAPVLEVAVVGLVMESVGASAATVVALGLLGAGISGARARGAAFAFLAAVSPIVLMSAPVLAGALIDGVGWRVVPMLWALCGGVMLIVTRRRLADGANVGATGELWTPALAGFTLALVVQTVSHIDNDGWTATATLVCAVGTLIALGTLVAVYRKSAKPSLSLAALKHGGSLLLLIVVTLVPFAATLWFYATVGFQYVYGLDPVETALALAPAQAAGVLGSLVAKKLLARSGITITGFTGLVALCGSLLLVEFVTLSTPLWLCVAIIALFAVASTWTGIPITNAIMNSAPSGTEGSAAAFRSAASNIGSAVGVVIISAMVFGTVQTTLTAELKAQGLASSQSAEIAEKIREGTSSESIASAYAVPVDEVDSIDEMQQLAMIDGLHTQSEVGAVIAAAAAIVFLWARRRQERTAKTRAEVSVA